jgi:carotenoid cleavage dioxygenase
MANRYLTGNFAPVTEEVTAFDLPVEGALPPSLRGRLIRNGPNPIGPQDEASYHWFTGDGMLHGIELRDGQAVSYRNRWVRTDRAAAALGEEPIPGQPDDVFIGGGSVANTHVVPHAGKIFALVETCLPTEVDAELATVGRYDFGGALRSSMTAHPTIDPATGEMVFFGYDVMGPPWLRYHVADRTGRLVRSEDIEVGGPVMVHDFAITETSVVFFDLPVLFDFELVGKRFPFSWKPEYGARVGVMPRDGGSADVVWSEVEPCYVFHPLNAYDDGDRVVVDVARHPSMFAHDHNGPADGDPLLWRWTIDPTAQKVVEEQLDDHPQEFPRIDDRLAGRRHRYGYGTAFATSEDGLQLGGVIKLDLQSGTSAVWNPGPGSRASEAVFVADDEGAAEDEGWLLSVVYDGARDGSDLVVLDATDVAAGPVATVRLPQRVPFGFHGSWVPDGDVSV